MSENISVLSHYKERLSQTALSVPYTVSRGSVVEVRGSIIRAKLPTAFIHELVEIESDRTIANVFAQVTGFENDLVVLSAFDLPLHVRLGARVKSLGRTMNITLGSHLLGSVVDGTGKIIKSIQRTSLTASHYAKLYPTEVRPLLSPAPPTLSRLNVEQPLFTGVRAIDTLIPIGCGQRMSIFAEPGVGKSTLMSTIARQGGADINVIALIGERGREVAELLNETLPQETLEKSVIVVSTSDESPLRRVTAGLVAITISEYFRDQGHNVLLQLDSLTRLLRGCRELGLGSGEIPVRRGYPSSVFTFLPSFIERAGRTDKGSITALYTILRQEGSTSSRAGEQGFEDDPMVEETKGTTDGHILLSRTLSEQGIYPAIDILQSQSRLEQKLTPESFRPTSTHTKATLALARDGRDSIFFGGSGDKELNEALEFEKQFTEFIKQSPTETHNIERSRERLARLCGSVAKLPSKSSTKAAPPV